MSQTKATQNGSNPYKLLFSINSPDDLRKLPLDKLPQVCQELRCFLIETLSNVGGHFASNLGAIELTTAIHYAFQTPKDKLIWDVGHQIYPHKILTGRRDILKSVRKIGGISGFPKREESIYDLYNTGHAGTSISQLLGEASARDHLGKDHKCVCVIGDASVACGMALEALNHGGELQTDCLVILNDNDMSISHNVGALNQYFSRLISSKLYHSWVRSWYKFVHWLPVIGPTLHLFSRRIERSFLEIFTPGGFFINLGFRYTGPIDGHNVKEIVHTLKRMKKLKGPLFLHVYTNKGRGFEPAESNPIYYHSVPKFNREDGSFSKKSPDDIVSFSQIVGETLLQLAKKNHRLVAITPAMIEGSGLRPLYDAMPERIYDVGIAEQHCVTFSGSLAAAGMVPFLCIYSTFLNRGLDQLIQDVALMNLPVRMIVDRAGCVGPDGETHQGLYDLGILLAVPNIHVYAPSNGAELQSFLYTMEKHEESPIAIRFPKASCHRSELKQREELMENKIQLGSPPSREPKTSGNGKALAILCIGTMWQNGLQLAEILEKERDITSTVIGLSWIRPLALDWMSQTLLTCRHFIIWEDSYLDSSAASYILQLLPPEIAGRRIHTFAFPSVAIEQGTREEIIEAYGLSPSAVFSFLDSHPIFSQKKSIS